MARDPRFLAIFRELAKDAADGDTGTVFIGNDLMLSYYPASGRFQWFGREGPITRAQALAWLLSTDSIKKLPRMTLPC